VNNDLLRFDPRDDVRNYFIITDKILGMGNYSTVYLGISKSTKERVAIKKVKKDLVKEDNINNEINILLQIDHPNIIKLFAIFESENYVYLVMELVTGGELFDRIVEKERYTEADAIIVMEQLLSGIAYLHSKGIVHRDIKPENVLLENDTEDSIIKIADFGLSRVYTEQSIMSTACGTAGYIAPEILKSEPYEFEVDLWSAGVIMYILLCGYPPFYDENDAILFENIINCRYEFHSPYWDHISQEAKELISGLLTVNPKQRLTAEEAINSEWINLKFDDNNQPPNIIYDIQIKLSKHNSDRKANVKSLKKKNTL